MSVKMVIPMCADLGLVALQWYINVCMFVKCGQDLRHCVEQAPCRGTLRLGLHLLEDVAPS